MQIKLTDKWYQYECAYDVIDKAPLVNEARKQIRDYWKLTICEFFECASADFRCVGITKERVSDITVLQYAWMLGFADFVDEFGKIMDGLQVPQKPYEKKAESACITMKPQEAAVVFLQKYFGLKSFAEADNVLLVDYMIARKASYNEAIYQRKVAELQQKAAEQQLKKRGKK